MQGAHHVMHIILPPTSERSTSQPYGPYEGYGKRTRMSALHARVLPASLTTLWCPYMVQDIIPGTY